MLDADLRCVLHLFGCAAHNSGKTCSGHRACRADLALASDFSTGNRGITFEQVTDGSGGQQERGHTLIIGIVHEVPIIVEHGGDDACRAVGRRSDDTASPGVLLGNSQSK